MWDTQGTPPSRWHKNLVREKFPHNLCIFLWVLEARFNLQSNPNLSFLQVTPIWVLTGVPWKEAPLMIWPLLLLNRSWASVEFDSADRAQCGWQQTFKYHHYILSNPSHLPANLPERFCNRRLHMYRLETSWACECLQHWWVWAVQLQCLCRWYAAWRVSAGWHDRHIHRWAFVCHPKLRSWPEVHYLCEIVLASSSDWHWAWPTCACMWLLWW